MVINKQGELLVAGESYIDQEGNLRSFKRFNIEDFKKHINRYKNCTPIEKSNLENYELDNMRRVYGEFQDTFLVIVDYPGIGFVNYFFLEQDEKYLLCLMNDKTEISNPKDFVNKMAYLAEYKV